MPGNIGWHRGGRIVGCAGRLIVAMWVLAALAVGRAEAAGKVALVIGNAAYQHTRTLSNPKNDAEAVAKLLRDMGFAPGDVTLRTDLDHRAMLAEVRAFIDKASGADTAVVYYAGHGIEVGGENYLVPVDAKLARDVDLKYEAIALASVLEAVGGARKLKLVILDACRTNPQADRIALRGQVKRTSERGLGRIEPGGDVLVAYAAKHGTAALDGKGTHSPYAEALLKHLATPGLDVLRMLGRVKETVLTTTGNQQEPWFYGSPGGETLSLVPAKMTVAPPVAPPVAPQVPGALSPEAAVRICRDVEGMSSLSVLGALADQHKGTAAAGCIAARVEELRKAQEKNEVAVAPPLMELSGGEHYVLAERADKGLGGERDPQTAAKHLLAAARAGYKIARSDLADDFVLSAQVDFWRCMGERYLCDPMEKWSTDARRRLQYLLAASGDYRGAFDGKWDNASRAAAKAYYSRNQ